MVTDYSNNHRKFEVIVMKTDQLLDYSVELSLLAQFFQNKLISEDEYQKIKQRLMNEYKIVSDLTTAMTA